MILALLMLVASGMPAGDPPAGRSAFLPASRLVAAALESLPGAEDYPWYDEETDGVRRLTLQPPPDLENRKSRWRPGPTPAWGLPRWFWQLLEVLGWLTVTGLLLLLLYVLVRFLIGRELPDMESAAEESGEAEADDDAPRLESLPFPLIQAKGDLLATARYYYEQGDFDQAVIYLYSYFLVQLDRRQLIRLARGKTNRQYLREVRRRPFFFELLQTTMLAFEDVFFGGRSLERNRFEACWQRLGEFQEQLEQASAG